jgi:hypothetical protein
MGMSATPNARPDGGDAIALRELAFDGVLNAKVVVGRAVGPHFNVLVRAIHYYGPRDKTATLRSDATGYMFMPLMLEQFLSDGARWTMAIAHICRLNREGHNTFVFCEERAPLERLQKQLAITLAPDGVALMMGGTEEAAVSAARESARVILTTYGYSSTGLSIDRMTAIVFLTPRKSGMQQILARIMRRGGDAAIERVVVDIIDAGTPVRRQYYSRKIAYEYYGCRVEKTKVCATA